MSTLDELHSLDDAIKIQQEGESNMDLTHLGISVGNTIHCLKEGVIEDDDKLALILNGFKKKLNKLTNNIT